MIEVGSVVKCFTDTTQPPKHKRKVVVCIDRQSSTLLINSELTAFARKTPDLLRDNIELPLVDHDFLEHDSYLDCSEFHLLNTTACRMQLRNGQAELLGQCSADLIGKIISTVEQSRNLTDRFRKPAVVSLNQRLRELMSQADIKA